MSSSKTGLFSIVIFIFFSLVVLSGCFSTDETNEGGDSKKESKAEKVERCEDELDNALAALKPRELGTSTDNETAIHLMQHWFKECGPSKVLSAGLPKQEQDSFKKYLSTETIQELGTSHFILRDGLYIRDCYLYREMGESIREQHKSELKSVVEIFYTVTLLVELDAVTGSPVPMSPFEVLLAGRGSAEDRATIFAGILQQLHIDAVLIQPMTLKNTKNEKNTNVAPCLVGVLLDDKVYLFDMQLGLPVPTLADETNILPQQPATLAEVISDNEILRQLDVNQTNPYPFKSEDFKSLAIKIICNSRCWSVVSLALQDHLTGDRRVTVYRSLFDGKRGLGSISRVMKYAASRWETKDVSVWSYPEEQFSQREKLTPMMKQQRQARLTSLAAPIEVQFHVKAVNSKKHKNKDGTPLQIKVFSVLDSMGEKGMMKTRIVQISGDSSVAIRSYQQQKIQTKAAMAKTYQPFMKAQETRSLMEANVEEQVKDAMISNQLALYSASFWTAVCQINEKEYLAASNSLNLYFKSERIININPTHHIQAQYLRALCSAQIGKFSTANQIIKNFSEESSYWQASQFLLKRWRKIKAKPKSKPTPPKTDEQKKEPSPKKVTPVNEQQTQKN